MDTEVKEPEVKDTKKNWEDLSEKFYKLSNEAAKTGLFLSQVIGNFKNAPDNFKNEVQVGCNVVVDPTAKKITLVYKDGTTKTI